MMRKKESKSALTVKSKVIWHKYTKKQYYSAIVSRLIIIIKSVLFWGQNTQYLEETIVQKIINQILLPKFSTFSQAYLTLQNYLSQ